MVIKTSEGSLISVVAVQGVSRLKVEEPCSLKLDAPAFFRVTFLAR